MNLSAKVRANQQNNTKSRGPISAAGKAHSTQNAFRHGLEIPVIKRKGALGRVVDLAKHLEGDSASDKVKKT